MLDNRTKKAIDDARDILVGKIPSPSAQVEQITLAMLYKFMDDMDQESIQLGGKATFFTGEYEQYSWKKIMSKTVSAQERYNKYTEGLEKFYINPKLPQTFKDVFKNASVPFREADILTMFLQTIDNSLSYNDSEQLGDAYEYLLAILGSQGDLGQFRTPRHIIDMIVKIVDPKKDETILDPACGTSGFLISAYKHVLSENTDKTNGDQLNFDEKKEILKHITGYDIEPSMVKIAQMNMFLHGANDPDIHEYDTLSNDSRWEEKFNIILANPPFMTPKGGIKPHKKFSITSSRAETLFVDYIINHLRREGRAGFIIPDSILYTEGTNSYDSLRKELVDNGLFAIVSLPVGIFKPYAKDIKTSILFVDKAKKDVSEILYLEVKHDGYTLTDTRKPTNKNDLPEAIRILEEYKKSGRFDEESKIKVTFLYKEQIENNKYILLPGRYKNIIKSSSIYDNAYIGKFIEECSEKVKDQTGIEAWSVSNKLGFVLSSEYHSEKTASDSLKNYKVIRPGYFAFNPSRINVGSIAYNDSNSVGCVSPMYKVFKITDDRLLPDYFFMYIKSNYMMNIIDNTAYGAVRKQLKMPDLKKMTIPLPSKEEQEKIIEKIRKEKIKIEKLQNEIDECNNNITDILLGVLN